MTARRVATAIALAAALVAPVQAERLAPGEPFLVAAETALAVLVGTIERAERLDSRAYSAQLKVERVVHGVADAARQTIAWEQTASSRSPRLEPGKRVMVALGPLPTSTLWRSRGLASSTWLVAAGGYAYLAAPDDASVELVAAYLRLEPSQRASAPGLVALSRLTAGANPKLATAALRRISAAPLDPPREAVAILARSADNPNLSREVRVGVLELLGKRRLREARAVVLRLAEADSELEPEAMETLAELDGGLEPPTVERLLADERASHRVVGARYARAEVAERTLPRLARTDPDPSVRAAAAVSLAATRTTWGLAVAIEALADPAPQVRSASSKAIAELGAVAVPALRAEIERDSASAPGAIATLALMGRVGHPVLVEVARRSESERLRGLALLALGQVRDEHH